MHAAAAAARTKANTSFTWFEGWLLSQCPAARLKTTARGDKFIAHLLDGHARALALVRPSPHLERPLLLLPLLLLLLLLL